MGRENGATRNPRAQRGDSCRWLCPTELVVNRWVDRALCAEFQLLDELCGNLEGAAPWLEDPRRRREIVGFVRLLTSMSPCVSCLCAVRQMQLLLPGVRIEATFRSTHQMVGP